MLSACSRSTSRDYSVGPSSPTPTSTSTAAAGASSRLKGSYYTLTPFETRRTAKTSDYSLTPFASRFTDTSSTLASAGSSSSPSASAADDRPSISRQSSIEPEKSHSSVSQSKRPTASDLGDSSDSAEEPPDGSKRDPNIQYLTSRACSPMDPDRDEFESRETKLLKNKNRNRLLSRTKTKAYPVGDRKRKRQLKNVQIQVRSFKVARMSFNSLRLATYVSCDVAFQWIFSHISHMQFKVHRTGLRCL
jgi:hypothetical protein